MIHLFLNSGPGSSVGIATGYGLDGPGIEYRWGWNFPHLSRPAPVSTQPPVQDWVFPGANSGRGVTLTPHPLLVPWSRKSRAIPLLPLWALLPVQSLSASTRVHFTFTLCAYVLTYKWFLDSQIDLYFCQSCNSVLFFWVKSVSTERCFILSVS